MIEGVLQVSEMTVRDIMIPRAQMDVVSIEDDPAEFIPLVLETRHSRFPVIGENKDDVVGILLAKELLNWYRSPETFNLHDTLRPAVFVPESKRLNVLLRDFRANRNHIAIVVDEYGGVSGLVTIEDVLEQIVGDIEDEYDFDESEDNIIAEAGGRYRVKAQTEIDDFNAHFGTDFADDEFDTVGGLVLQAFGRLPKRGEIDDDRRVPLPRRARRQPPPLHAAGRAGGARRATGAGHADVDAGGPLTGLAAHCVAASARRPRDEPPALVARAVRVRSPASRRCSASRRSAPRSSRIVTLALARPAVAGRRDAARCRRGSDSRSASDCSAPACRGSTSRSTRSAVCRCRLAGMATAGFCAYLALFPAAAGWLCDALDGTALVAARARGGGRMDGDRMAAQRAVLRIRLAVARLQPAVREARSPATRRSAACSRSRSRSRSSPPRSRSRSTRSRAARRGAPWGGSR